MEIEERLSKLGEASARCDEKWQAQRQSNENTNREFKNMNLRIRLLEDWKSNVTGKIAVVTIIAAFIGSILASGIVAAVAN